MMQILPIILVAAVMAVDGGIEPPGRAWQLEPWLVASIACLVPLLILLPAWGGVRYFDHQLSLGRVPRPVIAADRAVRSARWLIVANHVVSVLVLDWLGVVRGVVGDLILIDEFIALLPALFGLLATWWIFYPIERRILEAMLMRRIDEGRPIYPVMSRARYVLLQARMNLLLLLVPLLAILTVSEIVRDVAAALGPDAGGASTWLSEGATLIAAAVIFILSPLLARVLLDVEPLAPGELRETLLDVCRRHRVGMRELLLWKTNGSMINAAVMGLISPLRYVMITDALLETLRRDQVRAVMAHEVGHVRRQHMPWLVVCLLATLVLAMLLIDLPLRSIVAAGLVKEQSTVNWMAGFSAAAQLGLALVLFGWICRRFERQADTFAVQHLSGAGEDDERIASQAGAEVAVKAVQQPAKPAVAATAAQAGAEVAAATAAPGSLKAMLPTITPAAVDAMRGALDLIADLNTVDRNRHSWRHGSIRWRQEYLSSIIGKPLARLAIDRHIRGIKLAAAAVLASALVWQAIAELSHDSATATELRQAAAMLDLDSLERSP